MGEEKGTQWPISQFPLVKFRPSGAREVKSIYNGLYITVLPLLLLYWHVGVDPGHARCISIVVDLIQLLHSELYKYIVFTSLEVCLLIMVRGDLPRLSSEHCENSPRK